MEDLARRAGGVRRIFALGSPGFRGLGRAPEELTDEELVDLVVGEPRFLRRPLLVDGDRVLVGGREVGTV